MTSQEFLTWLKGFTEGVHEYNVTPKQWDLLKERLSEVDDDTFDESPGTSQDHSLQVYPPYWSPHNPFRVTSLTGSGTVSSGFAVTTTPNTQGYITVYNPSTSTAWYPSGSSISYTTSGRPTWYSINKIENDSREK